MARQKRAETVEVLFRARVAVSGDDANVSRTSGFINKNRKICRRRGDPNQVNFQEPAPAVTVSSQDADPSE